MKSKKQSKQVRCPHCGHKAEHQPTEIVLSDRGEGPTSTAGFRCAKCGGNFEQATSLRGRDWKDYQVPDISAAGISLAETAASINTLSDAFRTMDKRTEELRKVLRAIIEQRQRSRWRRFLDVFSRGKSAIELKGSDE